MNSLDIPRRCVVLRNGIEIWLPLKKVEDLEELLLDGNATRYMKFEDTVFNIADITGIFTPLQMEERDMVKGGFWKCPQGEWHGRSEFSSNARVCDCSQTLGNQVLNAGSFELWASLARERQKKEADYIDDSIKHLKERLAVEEKSIEVITNEPVPNPTIEEVADWVKKNRRRYVIPDKEAQIKAVRQTIEGIFSSIKELEKQKENKTTWFFLSIRGQLDYPKRVYPMTPSQVSDFKDFLDDQDW